VRISVRVSLDRKVRKEANRGVCTGRSSARRERTVRVREVGGSSPPAPTVNRQDCQDRYCEQTGEGDLLQVEPPLRLLGPTPCPSKTDRHSEDTSFKHYETKARRLVTLIVEDLLSGGNRFARGGL
jgi:hypothetical protein